MYQAEGHHVGPGSLTVGGSDTKGIGSNRGRVNIGVREAAAQPAANQVTQPTGAAGGGTPGGTL